MRTIALLCLIGCAAPPNVVSTSQDFQVCCDEDGLCGSDICDGGGGFGGSCSAATCQPNYCTVYQTTGGAWWYVCVHSAAADVGCAVSGCTSCGPATPGSNRGCFNGCDAGAGGLVRAECYAGCARAMTGTCQ